MRLAVRSKVAPISGRQLAAAVSVVGGGVVVAAAWIACTGAFLLVQGARAEHATRPRDCSTFANDLCRRNSPCKCSDATPAGQQPATDAIRRKRREDQKEEEDEEEDEEKGRQQFGERRFGAFAAAAEARAPPVYASAPKFVSTLQAVSAARNEKKTGGAVVSATKRAPNLHLQDLSTAAGNKQKKKVKKVKVIVQVVKKKKTKQKAKKRRVRMRKKIVVVRKKKAEKRKSVAPKMMKASEKKKKMKKKTIKIKKIVAGKPKDKFYEHISVPSKGVYKFGYRRGNGEHLIEREERKSKSHVKLQVKWRDLKAKGNGHHLFDYQHAKRA